MLKSVLTEAEEHLLYFTALELKSGPGSGPGSQYEDLDVLPEFALRERANNEFSHEELRSFVPPKWLKTLFLAGATSQDILTQLQRQIRRTPSHTMHLLVEIAINELIEFDGGDRALEEAMTEAFLKELELIDQKDITDK